MSLAKLIGSSPLFHGLDQAQLEKIAALASARFAPRGTLLFGEVDTLSSLYLLKEGSVKLTMGVRLWGGHATLRSIVSLITPGEVFGWSALIEPYVATLSAESEEDSTVVAVDAAGLLELMNQDHDAGFCIMKGLAHLVANRLRRIQVTWMHAKASDLQRTPMAAGLFTSSPQVYPAPKEDMTQGLSGYQPSRPSRPTLNRGGLHASSNH
jgi:CRP-like cAMP-binding protein